VAHTHLLLRDTVGTHNVRRTRHVDAALIVLEIVIAEAWAWDQAVEESVRMILGFLLAAELILTILVSGCRGLSCSCPWYCLAGVVGVGRGKGGRSSAIGGARRGGASSHAAEALEGEWLGARRLDVEGLHPGIRVWQRCALLLGAVLAGCGRRGKRLDKTLNGASPAGSVRRSGGRKGREAAAGLLAGELASHDAKGA
jgi:hypothetical protein